MTVTIDGITYEGTVDEIREIVRNPPVQNIKPTTEQENKQTSPIKFTNIPDCISCPYRQQSIWREEYPKQWDGSPTVVCEATTTCDDNFDTLRTIARNCLTMY